MRWRIGVVIKLLIFITVLLLIRRDVFQIFDSREEGYSIFDNIRDSLNSIRSDQQLCMIPKLKVNSTEINHFFFPYQSPVCDKETNWIYVENQTFFIDNRAIKQHGRIVCDYEDIRRISDYDFVSNLIKNYSSVSPILGDVFGVYCTAEDGKKYKNVHTSVKFKDEAITRSKNAKNKENGLNLNVYILMFDSVSRMTFMRKLPKTYRFITEQLKGIVLEGYNIVGDGTPQALIPILTGKTEQELPSVLKRESNADYLNIYPFIWNEFRESGYVTLFGEDEPFYGVFTYRMKGFKEIPTDHYMRSFYVAAHSKKWFNKQYCWGSQPHHKVHFAYGEDFFTNYPSNVRKFGLLMHGAYSHDDINIIGIADDDVVQHLKFFVTNNFINDTLIIVMADHGHRFSNLRETQQGKLEERLPFVSLIFPPWFEKRYPLAMNNLRSNINRLTTPFDLYPTLKSVLHFDYPPKMGNIDNRGISLFEEIPLNRQCENAGIDTHWCTCLLWKTVPTSDKLVKIIAQQLVDTINLKTKLHRDLCSMLVLKSIDKAAIFKPNKDLLKFKGSKSADGFVSDLSGRTKFQIEYFQLTFVTYPGNGLYEASLIWRPHMNDTVINLNDVSRINKYRHLTKCLNDETNFLSKWCVCSDNSKDSL